MLRAATEENAELKQKLDELQQAYNMSQQMYVSQTNDLTQAVATAKSDKEQSELKLRTFANEVIICLLQTCRSSVILRLSQCFFVADR
jgi:hypothetical protein